MGDCNVEVREFYNGYAAPRGVVKTVRKLLSTVPPKYLHGIDCVVLTNQSGLSREHRVGKVTWRKRRLSKSGTLGRYHRAVSGKRPWVELFVDNILPESHKYKWIPLVREIAVGQVLFHEIGHHIDATQRPEFRDKEDVADNWSKKFLGNFFWRKYWFLKPIRGLLVVILEFIRDCRSR